MKRKLKLFGIVILALVVAWAIHRFWVSADRWAEQPISQMKVGDIALMVMWSGAIYYVCHGKKSDS